MTINRRELLSFSGLSLLGGVLPTLALGQNVAKSLQDRVLILVELKGGNDSLNTMIPYADPVYLQLRNSIAIATDQILKIDVRHGLHPALKGLLPVWEKNELSIVQGLGYPEPNLSHFRSIDIWNTASKSNEYLSDGWIARAMQHITRAAPFTTQGVLLGMNDQGPLAAAQAVSLNQTEAFVNQSRLASMQGMSGNSALQHILNVENTVIEAAKGLKGERYNFTTTFPAGQFGQNIQTAAQIVANQRGKGGVPAMVLTLGSFDTHVNQLGAHQNLLTQLGDGLAALRLALQEIGAWDRSLVMTYSEFGRRARQNQSNGTDHGTVASHFVMGGVVRGGLAGRAPDLARLDGSQNLHYTTDFRQLFATVAKDWWGVNPEPVMRGRFEALPILRA